MTFDPRRALLMDNHKGALALWRSLDIRAATCIHVDAHLDVSNFAIPTPSEGLHGDTDLNCGNFLYPAIREGLVEHLVWVIPPHLPAEASSLLEWARQELPNWMWLTVAEARSLRQVEGRVEGRLAGARLTICTIEHLPPLPRPDSPDLPDGERPPAPILVDIDVDYFFDAQDRAWQTPLDLHDHLGGLGAAALTVAWSIDGGYTPLQHRYVGDLTWLCFTGHRPEAERLWHALQVDVDPDDPPPWYPAARQALSAWRVGEPYEGPGWEAAAALDPAYQPRPIDLASFYLHRKKYDVCLKWTGRVQGEEGAEEVLGACYLEGLVAFREGRHGDAERLWGDLVERGKLEGLLAAHVLEMKGKAQAARGAHEEALASFQEASRLAPQSASLLRQAGNMQRCLGQGEAAARTWRKAIALAPDDVATLQARWSLAELYVEQGQPLLARAELHQVIRQDEGMLGAKARLLSMKLEKV